MRMVERKQDALSTNFMIGLMEDGPKEQAKPRRRKQANQPELHVNLRPQPVISGDRTLEHLASRIVEEVTVSSSPRQLANQVLNQAGIETKASTHNVTNGHLRHVGQRARKIPQSPQRKVRRVKRVAVEVQPPQRRRGPPAQTRARPAIGAELEVTPAPRRVNSKKSSKRKPSRRGVFRR